MEKIDMSPVAISGRLRRVDELRDLCRTLAGSHLKYSDSEQQRAAGISEKREEYKTVGNTSNREQKRE